MEITEIKVRLINRRQDKLRAFCTITFDNAFVVRDVKIIEGANGLFVAMPSRKFTDRCHKCGRKNSIQAKFCNECGARLRPYRAPKGQDGRLKLNVDICHPINSKSRELIQEKVLKAYKEKLALVQSTITNKDKTVADKDSDESKLENKSN